MRTLALLAVLLSVTAAHAVGPACNQTTNLACASGTPSAQNISTAWTLQTGIDFITSNLGVDYTDSDTNPSCAAGEYKIYADTSETKLKKCMNGSTTDLDTGAGAVAWSDISNPTADLSLTFDSTEETTLTYGNATGTATFFTMTDGASNTGTGFLLSLHTATGSGMAPFRAAVAGTSNGVSVNASGVLAKIGTGSVEADNLVCTNCVAGTEIALASQVTGDLAVYNGTDWVVLPVGTSSQVLGGGSTPTWTGITSSMIGAGDLANALTWNDSCTADPCALTGTPRGADTALVFFHNLKLRRVSTCSGAIANEYTLGNSGCTGSGAPIACCTGAGTGTCENDIDFCWTTGIGSGDDSAQVTYEL